MISVYIHSLLERLCANVKLRKMSDTVMYLILRTLPCIIYVAACLIIHLGGQYSVSRLTARGWGWCTEKGWARGRLTSSEARGRVTSSEVRGTILTPAKLLSLLGTSCVSLLLTRTFKLLTSFLTKEFTVDATLVRDCKSITLSIFPFLDHG